MSLYELFFPEQAQTAQLKEIAAEQRRANRHQLRNSTDLESRISNLEDEMSNIRLFLISLIEKLESGGVVSADDLKNALLRISMIGCLASEFQADAKMTDQQLEFAAIEALGLMDASNEANDDEICRLKVKIAELEQKLGECG